MKIDLQIKAGKKGLRVKFDEDDPDVIKRFIYNLVDSLMKLQDVKKLNYAMIAHQATKNLR